MYSPFGNDELLRTLANDDVIYTAWNFLWSRQWLFPIALTQFVANNGSIYVTDWNTNTSYIRTREGVETILLTRNIGAGGMTESISATGRYMIAYEVALFPVNFWVYHNGVLMYTRNITVDNPLITAIAGAYISPDGHYVLAYGRDVAGNEYNSLYEGV